MAEKQEARRGAIRMPELKTCRNFVCSEEEICIMYEKSTCADRCRGCALSDDCLLCRFRRGNKCILKIAPGK